MRPRSPVRTAATCAVAVLAAVVLTVAGAQLAAAAGPAPQQDDGPGSGQRAQSRPDRSTAAPEPIPEGTELAVLTEGIRTVDVTDDESLEQALGDATPGDVIRLAPGRYAPIEIDESGTAEAPITLTGPSDAVIDASDENGYAVHLQEASHWQLVGFAVVGGGKGVVVDGGGSHVLDSLSVGETGDEAVHFRSSSSGNVIQRSRIHDTGLEQPQYGEGVYVGSAKSNWKKYGADGGPDLSMDNRILENTFERITAENVDIKEETGGTIVARNSFDGSAVSGENYADSVVDVKGYDAQILDNVTTGQSDELGNIIETHVITEPETSGCGNVIEGNRVEGFEPTGELVSVDKKCD